MEILLCELRLLVGLLAVFIMLFGIALLSMIWSLPDDMREQRREREQRNRANRKAFMGEWSAGSLD